MKCVLFAVYLMTGFFSPVTASAQAAGEDSSLYQAALSHTLAVYFNQVGDQSQLYNGRLYNDFTFSFTSGSPYFLSNNFNDGTVAYDNIQYNGVPLLYDDLRQQLITRDQGYWLQLVSERIRAFTLLDHHFIRMDPDSLSKSPVRTGFYEQLYSGNSEVLKRKIKNIKEELSTAEGVLWSIVETSDYFIKTRDGYHKVKSKNEFLAVLKSHRKEIHQFIKRNKLKYRKDKENTLVRVAAYYDQITK